jgi:hypothetical protein
VCFKQLIKDTAVLAASLLYTEPSALKMVGLYVSNFRIAATSL